MSAVLDLACELIRRPSVTPEDAGCQALVAERLAAAGFAIEHHPHGPVANLWARLGARRPLLVLAGHTDVVPPGPAAAWHTPPFEPTVRDGFLHGRGAADMKGAVAAMVVAAERFAARHPRPAGSLALLLTSDEEGPAVDGTARVVETLRARGEAVDWCLVGEPSSEQRLGDVVKHGRRGSLNGTLTVVGVQGHVAYPERADNPVHRAAPALAELCAARWDEGDEDFPPTSFQISNLHAGTGADNVIPGELTVRFNFRYAPGQDPASLERAVRAILDRHRLRYRLAWDPPSQPFITRGGPLLAAVLDAVEAVCGLRPRCSTGGGTSDGRFLAAAGAQVVELGPLNATIHQVDERVAVADLERLAEVYGRIIETLLAPG
ncbi:succinyl-diaminopimelate desuccinylase [Inmirania thermothiophila]|uniref:Succinyl-diaminopimelate desuccinylase n=1 Tax=Inmirania thermothiophila TaxID=1750597 RepID=A0A3N1Y102_9GAMM|nr:succinyl-diaminopimelate desuccinylase [Inmirania thermothiophila]ROR32208.1 succinyldiaminopimelate desuccinylase [Inmirania thermothiophila]